MFGQFPSNQHRWKREKLSDLCLSPDDIRCGPFGTQLSSSEFATSGVPLWGIKQTNRRFNDETKEFLKPEKAAALENYKILHGDIVMTRKGTIGNCAVFPMTRTEGIMHSDLLRIRVDENRCDPIFLEHQLNTCAEVASQLSLMSGGAIMPGINVSKLKSLSVYLPPIKNQRRFSLLAKKISFQKKTEEEASQKLDFQFSSIQYRAFRGEL